MISPGVQGYPMANSAKDKITVWLAEGFGIGRVPIVPGTWGSAVGLVWIWILLLPRNLWFYLLGIVLGFFAAVYIGGKAEKILKQKDPHRIVIDEIAAMPLAFLGCLLFTTPPQLPSFFSFLQHGKWHLPLAAFILFRIFDIVKPLGIYRSQNLPGGWGLVVDDYLAALLVIPLLALLTHWTI
jgi:phosphatidylglycerophosphatase A